MATIPTYADPIAESVLRMGVSGKQPVLISNAASVELTLKNGFDNQRQKAKNFGRVKFLVIDLAKASVEFTVMPDEEADFWRSIVPLFRQKGKGGNAPPIDVINLQLNRAGITTVTVLSAKIGQPSSKDGRRVQVELQEWAKAPTTPKPSNAGSGKFDPAGVEATVANLTKKS
jgi:hypothetical protein